MLKKLIALVEALMLVSLFCIGFATWSITNPNGVTPDTEPFVGAMQTETISKISLDSIGVGKMANQSGFEYNVENSAAVFSKTTLTVEVTFNKAMIETLNYTNAYYLALECKNTTNAVNIFTTDTYMIAPQIATAHLQGFPNQSVSGLVDTQSATATSLTAKFPVKSTSSASIYNLVSRSLSETATIVFTFDFTPTTGIESDFVKAICWSKYTLTFSIIAA